jgi:hypothetical protein
MSYFEKTRVWDGTNELDVNSEGRADVVQHSHPNNGNIHFQLDGVAASVDYILVDISDTTNYPHDQTGYVHIENLLLQVDSDVNGDYTIEIGYVDNVDATNGDFHAMYVLSGTKKVGNTQYVYFDGYPNAARFKAGFSLSTENSLNDTAFQTDVNLGSTLDPTTADTPSGDGDMVMRITRTAGTINISVNFAYHTH